MPEPRRRTKRFPPGRVYVGNLYRRVANGPSGKAETHDSRAIRSIGMKLAYSGKAGENPNVQGSNDDGRNELPGGQVSRKATPGFLSVVR